MSALLTRPRRYQLKKSALRVLASGHPWLYRGQLSSAAEVFRDGQWLALFDGDNRRVGTGMFDAEGAIAIRFLERSDRAVDAAWVAERVGAALDRRAELRAVTGGFRAIHGESDGLPAVVVDVYADTGVLQTYAAGADALGRVAAAEVARRLGLHRMLWKPAHRRRGAAAGGRVLRGDPPPEAIHFSEGGLELAVDLAGGQKSGGYLDLRGLRRWVGEQELTGRRVLNLFSYTGSLGLAAEAAGAAEVVQVDASAPALAFAARHHGGGHQRPVQADVFEWLPALREIEPFDLIIADPPPMTSQKDQATRALAAYERLYRAAAPHVAPGGQLVACCCTSRIAERELRRAVEGGLGRGFEFVRRMPPEIDHPVGFREADYLKILLYRRVAIEPPA